MLLLLVLVLVVAIQSAQGFVLELESTEQRCIFDLLKENMLFSGYFSVPLDSESNQQPTGMAITVLDPEGELVFKTNNARQGKFSFISKLAGRHDICVRNTNLLKQTVELKLKSGVEAKDLSEVAQQEHLIPLAVELLRLEKVAEEIRSELRYLFQSETDMREVNAETTFRVRFTTAFSLCVIVSVGLWQYFHVRAFLASKKVGGG